MNKKRVSLSIFILLTLIISLISRTTRANSAPNLVENAYPHWRASVSASDCSGPSDGTYQWYETDFNDSQWAFVSLPAINDIGISEDRFYRTVYNAPASGETYVNLASDDGVWLYVNEVFVGHWGGDCQGVDDAGCVGDTPWTCTNHISLDPINITTYLTPDADNVIAVHVHNEHTVNSTSYFFLSLHPATLNAYPDPEDPADIYKPLLFDLPIQYNGRDNPARGEFYITQQSSLTVIFDHDTTENSFQPFSDDTFSQDTSTCPDGLNCSDGSLALKFIATGSPKSVLPVADGQIITGKSGCLTGDELGCRVCIQHGTSGYSTLYYNMDDNGLITSGIIGKNDPIGYMGQVTNTLFEVNFVTYYDPLSNCTPGREVDPSGWSSVSSTDPYQAATGLVSTHLWIHPFLMNTQVLPEDSRMMYWQDTTTDIQFPIGTYSETLHVTLAPAPDPSLPNYYASPGKTFYFLGTDPDGNRVSQLENAIQIDTLYDPAAFGAIFPGSLGIYQFDAQTGTWSQLPTSLGTYTASATTQTLAPFAILGEKSYTLTLGTEGNGTAVPDSTGPYHYEDPVQLTATADPGWAFSAWSGDLVTTTNPVTITMDAHKTITATFVMTSYEIDITKVGNGQVELSQDGPYDLGDQVTLTATADPWWTFSDWSGDLITTTNPVTITIEGNMAITATFAIDTFTITASAGTGGSISPSGAIAVDYGEDQAFTITPDTGYLVLDVLVDGASVGAVTEYTFEDVAANHTIAATFLEGFLIYLPEIFSISP